MTGSTPDGRSRSVSSPQAGAGRVPELTDEEKQAPFFADLSDESAGRVLKYVEALFVKHMAERGEAVGRIPDEGLGVSSATCAALFLVRHCLEVNAATLTLDLGDVDIDDADVGDWRVLITRTKPTQEESPND